jgi:hypothetical protein
VQGKEPDVSQISAKYQIAGRAQAETAAMTRRLQLRFVPDHPIVEGYSRSREALQQGVHAVFRGRLSGHSEDPWHPEELDPILAEARTGFDKFSAACRDLIGPPTAIEERPAAT